MLSFVIHIVISVVLTLAIAKTTYELVITETNVYVVADVSYSSYNNYELIDEYIDDLQENAPKNTKFGLVVFANGYEVLSRPGDVMKSVVEHSLDVSKTSIGEALEHTGTLFKSNVIY